MIHRPTVGAYSIINCTPLLCNVGPLAHTSGGPVCIPANLTCYVGADKVVTLHEREGKDIGQRVILGWSSAALLHPLSKTLLLLGPMPASESQLKFTEAQVAYRGVSKKYLYLLCKYSIWLPPNHSMEHMLWQHGCIT